MKLSAILIIAALGTAPTSTPSQAQSANAHAGGPALVQPGAWLVTPSSDTGATLSYRLCFKTGTLDDLRLLLPNLAAAPGCPAAQIESTPTQLTWSLACPAHGLRADARYRLTAARVDGEFTIAKGNPPTSNRQSIVARLDGPCP